jgi:hypothetical protein
LWKFVIVIIVGRRRGSWNYFNIGRLLFSPQGRQVSHGNSGELDIDTIAIRP